MMVNNGNKEIKKFEKAGDVSRVDDRRGGHHPWSWYANQTAQYVSVLTKQT